MKNIFLLFILLGCENLARASTCSDYSHVTREMFTTADGKYIVFQIFQHNDDGAGYNHWQGSLDFFDLKGKHIGSFENSIDDPIEEPMPEQINSKAFCSPDVVKLFPQSKEKIEKLCQPQKIRIRPERMTQGQISKFQSEVRSELKLSPLRLEKQNCGLSVKVHEASFQGEEPKQWGLSQLLFKRPDKDGKISLLRVNIPPGLQWNFQLIGCMKIEQEMMALMTLAKTESPCLGEARQLPKTFLFSPKVIESSEMNIKGLRALKEKKYSEAQALFQAAMALDPENELAVYNLASTLALMKRPYPEGETLLKSFLRMSLQTAKKMEAPSLITEDERQKLIEKLKSKIRQDPDLKIWPELKKSLASWHSP